MIMSGSMELEVVTIDRNDEQSYCVFAPNLSTPASNGGSKEVRCDP